MSESYYSKRIDAVKKEISACKLDAFLVTSGTNVTYLTGFRGHDSILLITRTRSFFVTDSRYLEEAEDTVCGFDIRLVTVSTYQTLKDISRKMVLKKIGFESMDMPYGAVERLKDAMPDIDFVPMKDLVESLRAVKDASEIQLIKKSVRLVREVLVKAIGFIKPGIFENDVAQKIELEFIKHGACPAFDTIAAAGANSSKPHAIPGRTKIRKDSFVMIDTGCVLDGYNSDITRMVLTGRVREKFKKIYNIVDDARKIAIDAVKPGSRIADIDYAGRGYIQKKGFGKYFGHSLGHGVGLEVHEQPSISKLNESLLKPGMVFTIEPGIYIPDWGGVRIEDTVVVTQDGCRTLTKVPKQLMVL